MPAVMCMAETSTIPSCTALLRTISSTCGVMCTYARWVFVLNFRYSVRVFISISNMRFELAQGLSYLSARDQCRDPSEIPVHDSVFIHRRTDRPDRRVRCLPAFRRFEWSEKIKSLGHCHGLDRQNVACIIDDSLQLGRSRHPHGDVVFLIARGCDRVDRCGMRQDLILADQRGSRDLRHHETGIQSGARRQKRWQAFAQCRIDQTLDPPFANASQCAERDCQKIQRKSQRLTVKVSA